MTHRARRLALLAFGLSLSLAACGDPVPTPTGAACPSPDPGTPTYADFGMKFMTDYCVMCHDSHLTRSMRNGAPIYHDFDTLLGVLQVQGHIDERTGSGPDATNEFMPPSRCPSTPGGALDSACKQPTAEERRQLSVWLACEVNRPHTF
jgi:hypothetical protein